VIPTSQHRALILVITLLGLANISFAVSKPHVVVLGKWTSVQWFPDGNATEKPILLKVRPLLVDARVKEFTLGPAHDVTDRLFVVRRAFRVNDSLPQDDASPHWQWQRGGWLLVDRVTGHISAINLPEFDAFYSSVSWYRDYAAYCGISEDGKKVYALVAQISRRKPVLKKPLEGATWNNNENQNTEPDSACPVPTWQRAPVRITFEAAGTTKQTFAIRGHVVDVVTEDNDEEASEK
jgi:hypothetical protein